MGRNGRKGYLTGNIPILHGQKCEKRSSNMNCDVIYASGIVFDDYRFPIPGGECRKRSNLIFERHHSKLKLKKDQIPVTLKLQKIHNSNKGYFPLRIHWHTVDCKLHKVLIVILAYYGNATFLSFLLYV